jgi:hypothetical protein
MRITVWVAAGIAPLLSGCADLATGLAMYADQLDAEAGYYYDDQHFSSSMNGDCSAYWERGRMNNQSYQRIRNTSPVPVTYTLEWSSGYESSVYLEPGATSDIYYMTPSVTPSGVRGECNMPDN